VTGNAGAGTPASGNRSALERFLGLFAPVHGGEGVTVLLLGLNVFLLLTAYYIIKPVREALILTGGGAELKAYAAAMMAGILLFVVPLYARLAGAVPRRRLINSVTLFFVGCLVVFYVLARAQVPLGLAFYLWVGIFNLMVVAQFWAFANDLYTPSEGKRLFAIVAFGASLGAVLGAKITDFLIEPLGVYQLLLVSGGILGASLLITNLVDTRERERKARVATARIAETEEPIGKQGAFRLVFGNRYLLLIAFMILLLNLVNTTGEYILGRVVVNRAADAAASGAIGGLTEGEYIGKFYADFFFVVNIAGVVIQLFLVSRILKYLGVRVALLILPAIALGGYALLAFYPVLSVVRWAKTAENATDYSLQNTLRGVLFLPTTREEKYKAKQAIDTFFVRTGDTLQALLVYAGVNWLAFRTEHFAMINLGLVGVWFVLAALIGTRYRKLAGEGGS
jgi:AAA family ATP:ADP antiporter